MMLPSLFPSRFITPPSPAVSTLGGENSRLPGGMGLVPGRRPEDCGQLSNLIISLQKGDLIYWVLILVKLIVCLLLSLLPPLAGEVAVA